MSYNYPSSSLYNGQINLVVKAIVGSNLTTPFKTTLISSYMSSRVTPLKS